MVFLNTRYLLFFSAFCFNALLFSCNESYKKTPLRESSQVSSKSEHQLSLQLSGQSYFFAPELDSTTCRAIGFCDCCSWNVYFVDSVDYVIEDYCIDGDTYTYGTYYELSDTLVMRSDTKAVLKNYPDDFEESENTAPTFEIIDCKPFTSKCRIEHYKGKVVLSVIGKNRYFGTRDTIEVATRMAKLEEEGILQAFNRGDNTKI